MSSEFGGTPGSVITPVVKANEKYFHVKLFVFQILQNKIVDLWLGLLMQA